MDNNVKFIEALGNSLVINNLIDKLSQGAGWLAMRDTPNKHAIDVFIREIEQSDYDPLLKASLISNANKIIKEYSNQINIIGQANNYIKEDAAPQNVEDDWISLFMDKARLVSDEQFQEMWGKVLATECNQPNSIPKALLYVLAQMDREDAKCFTMLCAMTATTDVEAAPVIVAEKLANYNKYGINFQKLIDLASLGLIKFNGEHPMAFGIECREKPMTIKYYDEEYVFKKDSNYIAIGNVLYTKTGNALYNAMEVPKLEEFWEEFCLDFWKEYEVSDYIEYI